MTPTSTATTALTQTFILESTDGAELFITAVPAARASAADHAVALCGAVANVLQKHDAWIMQERVFGVSGALELLCRARTKSYGPRAGNVRPLRIEIAPAPLSDFGGIQVHAVCKTPKPEEITFDGLATGRIIRQPKRSFVTLSTITSPEAGSYAEQTYRSFEKAETLLKQVGADFFSVARTWWWLKDICSWYGEFNKARNTFFTERGLLGREHSTHRMPASTGIGVNPANDVGCALDVVALVADKNATSCVSGAGNQDSAYKYGSAFSRVSRTATPGGDTVFVSGTAAIDAKGASCHIGNAGAQVDDTLENVIAVLKDMKCRPDEVVHAIAYCKTPEVEKEWRIRERKLGWPAITIIADVCRDELLFELEAAAAPGMRRTN